jgi:hypothetical protein
MGTFKIHTAFAGANQAMYNPFNFNFTSTQSNGVAFYKYFNMWVANDWRTYQHTLVKLSSCFLPFSSASVGCIISLFFTGVANQLLPTKLVFCKKHCTA